MEHLGLRPFWTEPNLVYVHLTGARRPDLTEVCAQYFYLFRLSLTIFRSTNSTRLSTFVETTNSSLIIQMNQVPSKKRARGSPYTPHLSGDWLGWRQIS